MKPLYHKFSRSEYGENGVLCRFWVECPENFNFAYDVADAIAGEEPQKTALVWCNPEGEEKILSFAQLRELSNRAANYLSRCGVRKGDRVMLMLKRRFEYWYLLLALHKLGAVAVPATHMLKKNDIIYRVGIAGISAVLCAGEEEITENISAAAKVCPGLTGLFCVHSSRPGFRRIDLEMMQESPEFSRVETVSTEPSLLYFTSGTTGEPKPVLHDYAYPLAHIVTAKDWQGVRDGGLHLSVADTGWGKASWGKIYGQWLCGAAVMVYDYDRFRADELLNVIQKYHVTSFCAPPTVYRLLMKSGLHRSGFRGVEEVTTAGEAINPELIYRFRRDTGLTIREGYGQTETTMLVGTLTGSEVRPGSMGKASPQYCLCVADEDGRPVPDGTEGEVVVVPSDDRRAGLCIFGTDLASQLRAWKNGVYHTGDIARRDRDGYFWYIGRKDDIIKSSGYRISPFEVENVLVQHPAVYECAVTGVPDEERGFLVKASVVLNSGFSACEELAEELKNFVKQNTAAYKYPRIVEFVPFLPKTISGKIKRHEIRKTDEKRMMPSVVRS
ncbi:MAG: AMP-binding protein [Firmicutes bacterium]|nr:AMP-binding protein [Bacillota bacterium]